ncbi:MAG: hypothetical protein JXB39_00690 [Deltaproteobacteria bacterium]|nr:hypothetical protein [Deltaproteobacteria bacterium]
MDRISSAVSGSIRRYPMARLLGSVYRSGASGTVRLQAGATTVFLEVNRGGFVQVRGVPGLLPGGGEDGDLARQVEARLARGDTLDDVAQEVTRRLGEALSGFCGSRDGTLSWEPGTVSPDPVLVQPDVLRVLDIALRKAGSVERGREIVDRRGGDLVHADMDVEAGDVLKGLDPISLRVLQLAAAPIFLRDLMALATSTNEARRPEVLHRIALLLEVDLLRFEVRDAASSYPPMSPRVSRGADTEDPRVMELEAHAVELTGLGYYARLGLEDSDHPPTPEEISAAFRTVSNQFHPDRFASESPLLQRRAAECFAVINDAQVSLRDPSVAEEEWQRIEHARKGIPFVSDRDRRVAALSWKQAELLFQNRDYAVAEACYAEALRRDPGNARYQVQHTWCAFLAHQIDGAEALRRIEAAPASSAMERSRFLFFAGQVAKLSGAPEAEWIERFGRAVELNPENRDAQREIRLYERRIERTAPRPSLLGRLKLWFQSHFQR